MTHVGGLVEELFENFQDTEDEDEELDRGRRVGTKVNNEERNRVIGGSGEVPKGMKGCEIMSFIEMVLEDKSMKIKV